MKQKLFTLLTLLCFAVSGAWAGEEFTITPSLSKNNATLGYGLVTITKAGIVEDCKFGSGKIQSSSSGKTFSFTVATTYAGVTIKSITFSSFENKSSFTCTGGSLNDAGTTFTPSGDKNTATFTYVPTSEKTGKLALSIVLDGGTNDIETISTFTGKTDNKFAFTTKKNGATVDNDVTISSADATASSNNISWGNSKVITISATENINFIGLNADEDITKGVSTDVTAYSNTAWNGTAKSISFTNSTGGGRTLYTIYLIKEAAVSCTISFDKGEGSGIAPSDIVKNAGNNITLPYNRSMFKDGYTMTGWDEDGDGTADYAPGAVYSVTADATLTAVYTDNEGTTLDDRTVSTEVMFDFMLKDSAPSVTWSSGDHFWVGQATVAGKTIDVKADIAFGSGLPKFDNSSWTDWAQINANTTFTIPSANGASVEMISYNQDETTTVDGTELTSTGSEGNYTCTADISSAASTVEVAFNGAGSYYKYIKVTLPGPTYDVDFTLSNVTKTSGDATVEGGTQYTAEFAAADGYALPASVEVTAGGSDITANCTWTKATGELTIPAAYVTGDIAITVNGVTIAGSEIIRATITAASTATPSGTIYKTTTTNLSGHDAGKSGWKFSGNGSYVLLTLADGYTFKKGDIVNVHITAAPGQGTMAIYSSANAVLQDTGVMGGEGDNNIVLSADVDGQQSIKFLRTSTNTWNAHIDYISVTRPVSVTVGKNGYTTFASAYPMDLTDAKRPAGLKAYKATLDGATLKFTALNQTVPAGTGLLLLGENDETYQILPVSSGDAVSGNDLVGVTKPTAMKSIEDDTYYFVMKKAASAESALEFLPLSTSSAVTIPAGKAYVEVPNSAFTGAHELTFTFEEASGDVTGIATVNSKKQSNSEYFNLNGQRVDASHKGIVIVNGKKFFNK